MRVTSITVCRKGSVRIKDKWASLIGGQTLIERKIDTLKACSKIDEVAVGTNIPEMEKICLLKDVSHYQREEYFCDESRCSANEMIYDMCKKVNTDIIVWAHCTNPLIRPETYDNAVDMFLEKELEGYDSLVSADILREHLWTSDEKPMNYNPYAVRHPLAKELGYIYALNGAIFIQRRQSFLNNKYFFGKKPFFFETKSTESIDINEIIDLQLANFYLELTK